jgi:hypothetical protein
MYVKKVPNLIINGTVQQKLRLVLIVPIDRSPFKNVALEGNFLILKDCHLRFCCL